MDVSFDATYLSDLILDTVGIFSAFTEYLFFIVSILLGLTIVQFIVSLLSRKPRRVRNRF